MQYDKHQHRTQRYSFQNNIEAALYENQLLGIFGRCRSRSLSASMQYDLALYCLKISYTIDDPKETFVKQYMFGAFNITAHACLSTQVVLNDAKFGFHRLPLILSFVTLI